MPFCWLCHEAAHLEVVRAERIHILHASDYLAIFIKTHYLTWEISLKMACFHENWENYIFFSHWEWILISDPDI